MSDIVERLRLTGKIVAVLQNAKTGDIKVQYGHNLVGDKGDRYYAQMATTSSITDDFDGASSGLRLGSDATAPNKTSADVLTLLAGTQHALDATYPKTSDIDADNTGAGADIVTWRYSYTTSEGNVTTIVEGAIVDNRTTPTGALTRFTFATAFSKTNSDTLKIFVNHTFNGT
jgi:hypothetical protein